MKKKIIILLSLITFVIFVTFIFLKIKQDETLSLISFSKILAAEGVIREVDKSGLSLETSVFIDDMTEEKRTTTEKYFFDENAEFFLLSQELKSEEDFRQEEKEYNIWLKQDKESMAINKYRDAPSWQKQVAIKLADLKVGDQTRILYYKNKDNQPFIFKLVIKSEPKNEDTLLVEDAEQEIEIYGQIGEVKDGQIILKNNSYTPEKDLTIIISSETEITKKIQKMESEFRKEENEFREALLEAKEKTEDISQLVSPDWFSREKAEVNALKPGLEVKISAIVANEIKAKRLEFISK